MKVFEENVQKVKMKVEIVQDRTHQPRRIGTKEIKVGNIQAAQIIANADLVIVIVIVKVRFISISRN